MSLIITANVHGFAQVGIRIPFARLAVAFKNNITAKLLKLIRITNAEWLYSSAQLAQSRLLPAVLISVRDNF